jgi:hypothetical protein
MILKRDDAFTVVCELKTPKEDGSYVVGTGIFVTSPAGNVSFPIIRTVLN